VRLSRANASTLYALVEKEGVLNTTVTLTGSSQIALARKTPQQAAPGEYATQPQPQVQTDDGYIHPADGSSDVARYPAPRTSRRLYNAQVYQQQQYYDNRGYAPQYAPQVYAPRPYYQPRGLFD